MCVELANALARGQDKMQKLFMKWDRQHNFIAETPTRAAQNSSINPAADQAVQELVQGKINAEHFIVIAVLAAIQGRQ